MTNRPSSAVRPSLRASAASVLFVGVVAGWVSAPHSQESGERNFSVAAHKYAFAPTVVEVNQDDLVRITLTSDDIPHSFTVDKYRIAKRVEPGKPVVFEFRADQPGRFPIYCNLAIDDRCKEMHGELVVKAR
jgi:heme/copper-type cytochrome/quinol oxidase subunit 2